MFNSLESSTRPSILVVDDEPDQRQLLHYLLDREYEVEVAADAADALAMMSTRTFDLALVDQRMPGMLGTELLARLSNLQPTGLRFLVTASGSSEVLAEAINRGKVSGFIAKPVDPAALLLDIRRALKQRSDRAKLDSLAQRAALGGLAATLVHNLRNCLQVLAMVPAMIAIATPSSARIGGDMLHHAEESLSDLVDALLLLSQAPGLSYELTAVSLPEVIQGAVQVAQQLASVSRHGLQVDIQAELPLLQLAPQRCQRMLVNLLRVAADRMSVAGRMGVRVWTQDQQVLCEIWDEGPAVPAADRDAQFEPVLSADVEHGMGGLELAICRAAMMAHGGSLTQDNRPDGGSRFLAAFPLPG